MAGAFLRTLTEAGQETIGPAAGKAPCAHPEQSAEHRRQPDAALRQQAPDLVAPLPALPHPAQHQLSGHEPPPQPLGLPRIPLAPLRCPVRLRLRRRLHPRLPGQPRRQSPQLRRARAEPPRLPHRLALAPPGPHHDQDLLLPVASCPPGCHFQSFPAGSRECAQRQRHAAAPAASCRKSTGPQWPTRGCLPGQARGRTGKRLHSGLSLAVAAPSPGLRRLAPIFLPADVRQGHQKPFPRPPAASGAARKARPGARLTRRSEGGSKVEA